MAPDSLEGFQWSELLLTRSRLSPGCGEPTPAQGSVSSLGFALWCPQTVPGQEWLPQGGSFGNASWAVAPCRASDRDSSEL